MDCNFAVRMNVQSHSQAMPGVVAAPLSRELARSDLFFGVSAEQLAKLAEHAWTRSFRLGEHVFETGQQASVFTIVARGAVKIVSTGADGDDCILGLYGTGQSIGTSAATKGCAYRASAHAITSTVEVIRVDARRVLQAAHRDVSVATALNRAILAHGDVLRAKIAIMSAGSVSQRLAKLLLALAERFGDELEGGRLVLSVALSRMDLAGLVGASAESVLRVVSAWQHAGILGRTPRGLTLLRPEALHVLGDGSGRDARA